MVRMNMKTLGDRVLAEVSKEGGDKGSEGRKLGKRTSYRRRRGCRGRRGR